MHHRLCINIFSPLREHQVSYKIKTRKKSNCAARPTASTHLDVVAPGMKFIVLIDMTLIHFFPLTNVLNFVQKEQRIYRNSYLDWHASALSIEFCFP